EQVYPDSEISISSQSNGITLQDYRILSLTGQTLSGTANSNELRLAVGEMGADRQVSGEVQFRTRKEGVNLLEIALLSAGEKIFVREIRINTEAAQPMAVDVLPKIIVPFIQNNVLVKVQDEKTGNELPAAYVQVLVNGKPYSNGKTNPEGIYAFELAGPNAGDTVEITAEKTGYQEVHQTIKVSENILTVLPTDVSETITLGQLESASIPLVLRNLSLIPLRIEEVSFAGFEDYVNVQAPTDLKGKLIDILQDTNTILKFSLSPKGEKISKPTEVKGEVIFKVGTIDTNSWFTRVPVSLHLGFGGEVSDTACFGVNPNAFKIIAGTEVKKLSFDFINHCQSADTDVFLYSVQAKIKQSAENPLGEFKVTARTEPQGSVLGESFTVVAPRLAKNETVPATLEFKPENVAAGAGEYEIEFKAIHRTQNGDQELSRTMKVSVQITNLAQCVEVTPDNITLESCLGGTGYGNYGNQFGGPLTNAGRSAFNPNGIDTYRAQVPGSPIQPWYLNSQSGYGGNMPPTYLNSSYNGFNNYNGFQQDYRNQPAYPNMQYYNPLYSSDFQNNSFNNTWRCGSGQKLLIRNNCAVPIKVDVSDGPQILVEKSNFTIEPNSEGSTGLSPAYLVGRYELKVKAKVATSNENTQEIKTVPVTITSELLKTYTDCISISPEGTLSFNEFIPKAKKVKVINTCYNSGIHLLPNSQTIRFTTSGLLNPSDRTTNAGEPNPRLVPGQSDNNPFNEGFPPGTTPVDNSVISAWEYLSEDFQTSPEGAVTQVLTFEVARNLSRFQTEAPKLLRAGKVFQQVGEIRYWLTACYYAVKGRTNMQVSFISPQYGSTRTVTFPLTVEDYWKAGDCADGVISYGDMSTKPAACLNKTALNFTPGQCIEEKDVRNVLKTKLNGGLFKYSRQTYDFQKRTWVEGDGCGSMDKITGIAPQEFKQNNISFEVKNDGHEIEVIPNFAGWDGEQTKVSQALQMTVSRFVTNATETTPFQLNFEICKRGKEQVITTGPTTACPAGVTGETVYKKYGFDKLSLEWNPELISKDYCDRYQDFAAGDTELKENPSAKFCDGLQFAIAFSQKKAKFDEFVKKNKAAVEALDEKKRTADELFQKLLEGQTIKIMNFGTELRFIKGADNGFVKLPNLPHDATVDTVNAGTLTDPTSITNTLNAFNTLLGTDQKENAKKILILIPTKGLESHYDSAAKTFKPEVTEDVNLGEDKTTLGILWADTVMVSGKEYMIWTGEEYLKVQEELRTAIGTDAGKDQNGATIKRTDNPSVKVEPYLLNLIYNNSAVIYAKLLDGNAQKDPELFRGKTILPEGYDTYEKFRKDILEVEVFLKQETYNAELAKDFNTQYKDQIKNASTDLSFKENTLQPGEYMSGFGLTSQYVIYFGIPAIRGLDKIQQDLRDADKSKKPTEFNYLQNALFYHPFDGELGTQKEEKFVKYDKREGYGRIYTQNGAGAVLYLNDKQVAAYYSPSAGKNNELPVNYVNALSEEMAKGKILSVDRSEIQFLPSDPVVLSLDITGGKTGSSGVLFELRENQTRIGSFDEWNLKGENEAAQARLLSADAVCPESKKFLNGTYYGFTYADTNPRSYEKVAYLPSQTSLTNQAEYSFFFGCANPKATLNAFNPIADDEFQKSVTLSRGQDPIRLDFTQRAKLRVQNQYPLNNLTNGIKKEVICVQENGSSRLDYYWNEPKLQKATKGEINLRN
ncbi:MAG: hypothetical protein HY917_00690, partial [Candidatus Diapherotrites archaeon]|nr:hypothetical protein [Candidatus Diapherotrites archaeon]